MRLTQPVNGYHLGAVSVALSALLFSTASAQRLTAVESVALADGNVELRYHFDRDVQAPKTFYLDNKNLLVLDFASTGVNQVLKNRTINNNIVSDVQNMYANNKVRSTVKLKDNSTYSVNSRGNEVVVTLAPKNLYETTQAGWQNSVQSNVPSQDLMVNQPVAKDVGFFRNSQGAGVIEVFLPNAQTQVQLVDEQTRGLTVSVPGVAWNPAQVRRIEVTDFATPVSALEVVNNNGTAAVRIRTQSNYEYSTQQIGSKFQLIVKPKRQMVEQKKSALGEKDVFTGDLISINFQDIDVRAILQIIADFTGLNIVVSDSVNSRITIRLQNVPWDQALDVVLRSKGLVKQQSGNVVYIMPANEARTLAPDLITEIIQINNAKAAELAQVLSSQQGTNADGTRVQSTGISEHGSLTVDPNQNLLIVRDTPEQMRIVRELINRLDRPLRQVVIKAQIVATTDTFARELGVKWGIQRANRGSWTGDGTTAPEGGGSSFNPWNPNVQGSYQPGGSNVWGGGIVDASVAGNTGIFALNVLRRNFAAALELQAMQTQGRGEVLASPTLMTTDRQEAYINEGSQIAYSTVSDNGTNTEFKDVVMELKVTPSITPDDHIIMDIQIKKDDPDGATPKGDIKIRKREIKTQAIVRDGETVVLGGIYTVTSAEDVQKVPFLGDIPFVGNLFKNNITTNNKAELVIFLTPNIVK
ncbi:pilus assembly protein PilQ [Wohlfahrtiimonas chitiniclastica]|uniref:type IV pilus secretin PilQ n=1 Tax=Wohlfahrtiimonas chitiniclastica TaxID=400946 RepID=UPI000B998DAB|nr:type IV pilus secretin PilQ [Wohlfahrtiimonas chitiniclastica]MBS7820959.1 type IV pilus secretin PilQ [Wohlfahrtiimonas chitiniclastica]OYQ81033.1 pilus assembly protein PilQ [Wohlfahrtiimonas chitiniclastica]